MLDSWSVLFRGVKHGVDFSVGMMQCEENTCESQALMKWSNSLESGTHSHCNQEKYKPLWNPPIQESQV